jgi:hypothetical protein
MAKKPSYARHHQQNVHTTHVAVLPLGNAVAASAASVASCASDAATAVICCLRRLRCCPSAAANEDWIKLLLPHPLRPWHFTTSLDRSLTNYQANYAKLID